MSFDNIFDFTKLSTENKIQFSLNFTSRFYHLLKITDKIDNKWIHAVEDFNYLAEPFIPDFLRNRISQQQEKITKLEHQLKEIKESINNYKKKEDVFQPIVFTSSFASQKKTIDLPSFLTLCKLKKEYNDVVWHQKHLPENSAKDKELESAEILLKSAVGSEWCWKLDFHKDLEAKFFDNISPSDKSNNNSDIKEEIMDNNNSIPPLDVVNSHIGRYCKKKSHGSRF